MFSQQYRSNNQSWSSNKAIKSSIEYHHITDDILSGRIKNIDTLVRCCLKLRDELMNFNGVDFTTPISKLQYEFLLLMYKWVIASSLDNTDVIKQFNINIPEVQKTLLSTLFEAWTDVSADKPLSKGINQCHYKCKNDEIQYILDLLNHAGMTAVQRGNNVYLVDIDSLLPTHSIRNLVLNMVTLLSEIRHGQSLSGKKPHHALIMQKELTVFGIVRDRVVLRKTSVTCLY